jgi:hypothetical protein
MNNNLRANVAKTKLYFTINQCKKGVLSILKSDKIGRFYS